MKLCSKCQTSKNDDCFTSKDFYCRECRREININRPRNYKLALIPGEKSTKDVIAILKDRGIPACSGRSMGKPYVDLMAWACVPIEAKTSNPDKSNHNRYKWGFTPHERKRGFDGLFIFIAECDTYRRIFVVPSNVEWIQTGGKPNKTAVSVVFDTDHFNAYVEDELVQYENAFHLIEAARLAFSEGMV